MNRLSRSFRLVVLCLLASSPGWLAAQEAREGLRLMNPTDEVVSVYRELSLDTSKETYGALSSSMKQDLWSLHLSRALVELPELTTEQRAVILQGLGLVARGALGAKSNETDWELRFGESTRYVESRATELLPRDIAIQVFARLGAQVDLRGPAPRTCGDAADLIDHKGQEKGWPICSCSKESDFCVFGPKCGNRFLCLPTTGCGFLWLYDCDGTCSGDL